ncbi:MAG: class I SAM-dependent methyltransferase [Planctomycetota bacterium]
MATLYDRIGLHYGDLRRPDPRVLECLLQGLGGAKSILNVGAGAGSYEPRDRAVVALEPSSLMISQRRATCRGVVRGVAEALPFASAGFDACLAVLTLHHWSDPWTGVAEMRRVARERVVIVTWDPAAPGFWLTDYFPRILDIDRAIFLSLTDLRARFGAQLEVRPVPVPADCTDGFLGAYWCRPRAYLDQRVRSAISSFSKLPDSEVRQGLAQLQRDLASGRWQSLYGAALGLTDPESPRSGSTLDLGYRLVVLDVRRGGGSG